MIFSSAEFIIFFIIVICLVAVTNLNFIREKYNEVFLRKYRQTVLLLASYFFYGWWDWRFCILMAFLSYVAYISAKMIDKNRYLKLFKFIGIAIPLLVLGFFKYFNFFLDSFYTLFSINNHSTLDIILPVGISFYTFQSMSYTIDVMRKDIKPSSLLDVAIYVAFFPQLVAGPIVRASDFIPQLKENRNVSVEHLKIGIQIFLIGLFKKIVIADNLSVFVDEVFDKPTMFNSATVILAVISYSIQIYFDFSGYSDMGIGVAKCLGYDFYRNFNLPYISKNVSEFWKRWHISLSSWLQNYLYIPLGGNRKGEVRKYINLLLTMIIGGLWHGANWNFVLWGTLHGVALCIHKLFRAIKKNKSKSYFATAINVIITYIFVCVCWIPFRSADISITFEIIKRILVWHNGVIHIFSWSVFSIILVLASSVVAVIKSKREHNENISGFYIILNTEKISGLTILFMFIGIIIILAYTNSNPFIYFQF